MLRAFLRLLFALGGAGLATFVVALLEARAVSVAVVDSGEPLLPSASSLIVTELGLLSPVALGVGLGAAALSFLLEPSGPRGPLRYLSELRAGSVDDRLRTASVVFTVIVAAFGSSVVSAHVARVLLAFGKPTEAGLRLGVAAVGALVATGLVALALLPLVRRLLAMGGGFVPRLYDPALTGGAAIVVVGLLFALGIAVGDTSGGGGGVLGIFGVLKRPELDLRPLANASLIGLGALLLPVAFRRAISVDASGRYGVRIGVGVFAVLIQVLLVILCDRASARLGDLPLVARGIEKHAPLGKIALAVLRRATDHDKDGFSARFAGGDCNDHDGRVNPNAVDVPGNGVDEDCSGADTPEVIAPNPAPALSVVDSGMPKKTFNVILLTVDTLRPDLGFMNYKHPTSPNLDQLAEKGTIFERAYSMASYTGKSVGPMLIGKYPSETATDFSHFNTYYESNVFVAERLRDAGIRTFAGMCHWYFRNPTGLRQGFDVWDTSAIPPGMGDNDNVITSDRMADLALKLLQRPENVLGPASDTGNAGASAETVDAGLSDGSDTSRHRFFAWFHFFDPHAQYVPHPGSPDFSGGNGPSRPIYDQEVWYTDKHIGRVLDYVASQPWGEETAIVMTADHGEAFYEHGMLWHGSEIWEELVHVPLFVYVPGAEPRRVSQKRSHIDLVPTILDLMGVAVPPRSEIRGKSLLADVYLPKDREHEERDVYVDMPQGPFNGPRRAILTGPSPGMKLIHSGGYNFQLFDLSADPGEKHDLANDKEKLQAVIERMNATRGQLKEIEVKPK